MYCPASDQWRALVTPEDPDDWPPGTNGLVATMIRQQKAVRAELLAEAAVFMDEYRDDLTTLASL